VWVQELGFAQSRVLHTFTRPFPDSVLFYFVGVQISSLFSLFSLRKIKRPLVIPALPQPAQRAISDCRLQVATAESLALFELP
jgi:hypothetical protein